MGGNNYSTPAPAAEETKQEEVQPTVAPEVVETTNNGPAETPAPAEVPVQVTAE